MSAKMAGANTLPSLLFPHALCLAPRNEHAQWLHHRGAMCSCSRTCISVNRGKRKRTQETGAEQSGSNGSSCFCLCKPRSARFPCNKCFPSVFSDTLLPYPTQVPSLIIFQVCRVFCLEFFTNHSGTSKRTIGWFLWEGSTFSQTDGFLLCVIQLDKHLVFLNTLTFSFFQG